MIEEGNLEGLEIAMEALIVQSPRDTRLRRVGGAAVGVGLAVLRSRIAQTNVTAGELLWQELPASA